MNIEQSRSIEGLAAKCGPFLLPPSLTPPLPQLQYQKSQQDYKTEDPAQRYKFWFENSFFMHLVTI